MPETNSLYLSDVLLLKWIAWHNWERWITWTTQALKRQSVLSFLWTKVGYLTPIYFSPMPKCFIQPYLPCTSWGCQPWVLLIILSQCSLRLLIIAGVECLKITVKIRGQTDNVQVEELLLPDQYQLWTPVVMNTLAYTKRQRSSDTSSSVKRILRDELSTSYVKEDMTSNKR